MEDEPEPGLIKCKTENCALKYVADRRRYVTNQIETTPTGHNFNSLSVSLILQKRTNVIMDNG